MPGFAVLPLPIRHPSSVRLPHSCVSDEGGEAIEGWWDLFFLPGGASTTREGFFDGLSRRAGGIRRSGRDVHLRGRVAARRSGQVPRCFPDCPLFHQDGPSKGHGPTSGDRCCTGTWGVLVRGRSAQPYPCSLSSHQCLGGVIPLNNLAGFGKGAVKRASVQKAKEVRPHTNSKPGVLHS